MIERNWDRRPCGIRAYPYLLMTPPFFFIEPVTGQASKRPISVYTALSDLRFVSVEDEDTISPLDPNINSSPLSSISQLRFAPPEETMTPITPIEHTDPASRKSSPSSSITNLPSFSTREAQARIAPSEQFPSTARLTLLPPQKTGRPNLNSPVISGPMKTARRPLPEVPEHAHPRPLPPRPTKTTAAPFLQGFDRCSYLSFQDFTRDPSNNPLAPSRPVSNSSEHDTRSRSVGEKRPNIYPTCEDTPPVLRRPAPTIISDPTVSPPPTVTIPIVLPTTPKVNHTAPIFPDIRSPTSIDLATAARLTITGENGEQISFGSLFEDRKVIVILIRHFGYRCCQGYVRSISNIVTPGILGKRGVELVLIGNGAPGMIKTYKSTPSVAFCS